MCREDECNSAYSDNDMREFEGAFNKTQSRAKIAPFMLALET